MVLLENSSIFWTHFFVEEEASAYYSSHNIRLAAAQRETVCNAAGALVALIKESDVIWMIVSLSIVCKCTTS